MKVKTLIEKLYGFPQEAEVVVGDPNGYNLMFVCSSKNDDSKVWLESEEDCDMVEEIHARFEAALENGEDETDVYSQMLEDGIDVEMVRHYLGDEKAEHMWNYCYEHGLL